MTVVHVKTSMNVCSMSVVKTQHAKILLVLINVLVIVGIVVTALNVMTSTDVMIHPYIQIKTQDVRIMIEPLGNHVLMVTAILIVFASTTTNFSSLTDAMSTHDMLKQMVLTSTSVSQALSKMPVPPWMELFTLNVMTKMNVYPTMNLVEILKEVTPVLVIMVTAVTRTNVTMIINVNSALTIAISTHEAPILKARLHVAVI